MTNATAGFAELVGGKYINLETRRKNGDGVRTPVWFAAATAARSDAQVAKLYVYSTADSGKAKRIRRNGAVRIAACSAMGRVTGPWIDARAEIVVGEEFAHGMRLLDRKYCPWKQIGNFVAKLFGGDKHVVLAIHIDSAP